MTKLIKKNSFLTVARGDFNAKSQTWFKNDKTSYEGSRRDILTCSHGLHQLINEPTHLLDSSSSSIDLIFTSQPNLVMESGVQPSFHPNCRVMSRIVTFFSWISLQSDNITVSILSQQCNQKTSTIFFLKKDSITP